MITPRFRLSAAALVLGTAFLAGCNKTPTVDSTPTTPTSPTVAVAETDDATVTGKVQMELMSNEALKGLNISVVTTKGDVRIAGDAVTQEQADQVEKLVRDVDGVHSVHNELTIKK
jgi:hyperosmotically inducible periplasmic protein